MQVLSFGVKQECFALKGGTAINLFVRAFPRLSVDIDLVYLPMKGHDEALRDISEALDAISADLNAALKDIELTEAYNSKRDALRLIVGRNGVQIKGRTFTRATWNGLRAANDESMRRCRR